MRTLPDKCFDVIVADPPYNIGKAKWDKWPSVETYVADIMTWLREFSRLLKATGSLWMFHSDMRQFSKILAQSQHEPGLILRDFVVLFKRNFRAKAWRSAECATNSGLRSLFNVNEYVAHWFACPHDGSGDATGLERIYSNPGCFKCIKDWYSAQCEALGLTTKDIASKYTEVTGKKPYMLRHYFKDSQFEIPTEDVWRTVYEPLGFSPYEELRQSYEELRNYWRCDDNHCNVWEQTNVLKDNTGWHPTQKPPALYSRMLKMSCPPGGRVFDPFLGSGSSRIAAYDLGLDFVGCELDPVYYKLEEERFAKHSQQLNLFID
nr:MAG TPA: adenine-specific methyltransferase [Caudoviricetes sp.]